MFSTCHNAGRDPCLTEGGRHCVFPFTYLGTTYSSCTMEDAEVPWCPTEVDTDSKEFREGEHDWGTCSGDCQAGETCLTEEGENCVFPFIYSDKTFTSCTMEGSDYPWCATEVDPNMEYIEDKYGLCSEDCSKLDRNQTIRSTATTNTATTTPLPTTTACDGRCSKTNQKCDTVTGQCQCLEASEIIKDSPNLFLCSRATRIRTTLTGTKTTAGVS